MKAWCAALADEVGGWPQVTTRIFFGFTALSRKESMFALLPRTRGMETANALAFRLDAPTPGIRARLQKDPRIGSAQMAEARWFSFALLSDSDLRDALSWLGTAYEVVGKTKKPS